MGRVSQTFGALMACVWGVGPSWAQPTPPVSAFEAPETIEAVEMAPGGRHFFVHGHTSDPSFQVFQLDADGVAVPLHSFQTEQARRVKWARWATPYRLVFSLEGPPTGAVGASVESTRLFAIDANGQRRVALVQQDEASGFIVRDQDNLVDLLPNDPDHILVAYSPLQPRQPNVMRVNIQTGEAILVENGRAGVRDWTADAMGAVRLAAGKTRSGIRLLELRDPQTRRWRSLSHMIYAPQVQFEPVGFTQNPDELYVISNHEGAPSGVYIFDTARDSFTQTVYRHPRFSIADARVARGAQGLIAVAVSDDGEKRWFDPRSSQVAPAEWKAKFPDKAVTKTGISLDDRFVTLLASNASDSGSYFVYDRTLKTTRYIGPRWGALQGYRLGATINVEIPARDGVALPAQILSSSWRGALDPNRASPFVIMPHGGPGRHDMDDFDQLAQFVASRGFNVLRLTTRGSADAPPLNDGRVLGQAMMHDVFDAATWLIDNGYVDSWRLAMAGEGFGAYAALHASRAAPERFACLMSVNGVTDLETLTARGRRQLPYDENASHAERLWPDPRERYAQSPVRYLDQITTPLFLAHTPGHGLAPFSQAQALALGVRRSDGRTGAIPETTLARHPGGSYERRKLFAAFGAFLEDCLRPEGEASPELAAAALDEATETLAASALLPGPASTPPDTVETPASPEELLPGGG